MVNPVQAEGGGQFVCLNLARSEGLLASMDDNRIQSFAWTVVEAGNVRSESSEYPVSLSVSEPIVDYTLAQGYGVS